MERRVKDLHNAASQALLAATSAFVFITTGAVLSGLYYRGRTMEPYSPFNHFVSELGNLNYSSHGYFFNMGMMTAGPCVLIFMLLLSQFMQSKVRYGLILFGALVGVFCTLVGFYSSDRFNIHYAMALGLFFSAFFSSLSFNLSIFIEGNESYFHRWIAYVGSAPIGILALFIVEQFIHQRDFKNGHIHFLLYNRPTFWMLPFLEWMVVFSLFAWILCIALYLFRKERLKI